MAWQHPAAEPGFNLLHQPTQVHDLALSNRCTSASNTACLSLAPRRCP